MNNSVILQNIQIKRNDLYVKLGMIHTGKIKDKSIKDVEKEIKKLDNKKKNISYPQS